MGDKSGIEWTESTWNPVVGCTHISPGCDNCYAARETSGRLRHLPAYAGLAVNGQFTGEVRCLPERLDQPLKWRKPRLVFVNSMSDLFHKGIPDGFIQRVFDVMVEARQHTFQVLTKRPQRMRVLLSDAVPAPNVWLGTSIESDKYTFRANWLRVTPAAIRFLSLEPLLGPLPSLDLTGIDWVIVGGESGPGARPMHPDWVRDIRDRCQAAHVAFFFKQWGEWSWTYGGYPPGAVSRVVDDGDGHFYKMWRTGKKLAGRGLDGRTWDEYPHDDRKPLPGDGPDYHADHAAWQARQRGRNG
jgi:protein gp37